MADFMPSEQQLRNDAAVRQRIERELIARFAPEDEVLTGIDARAKANGIPEIQISPLQGKLLQVLVKACNARRVLEIGALAGYSGTWLARALPADGRLITLEVSPKHAATVRETFALAGLTDRTEVREGEALQLLPALANEAPFDFVFIDADKMNYPHYLDWAIKLSHPGTIIVADNVIRGGRVFLTPPPDESAAGAAAYNERMLANPRLLSVAFPIDDDGTDGFSISVVQD